MSDFLDHLAKRVLLCDGATGSRVQIMDLVTDTDFEGQENCTEVLNRSRPDLVRDLHNSYLAAGADIIQTNSFGGSPITLGEFGLADDASLLNRLAAELANEACESFSHDGRHRFVLGSVGPGTRLPGLGHVTYDELFEAYFIQCDGLISGGIDAFLIETCQDVLQIKAAVNGAKKAIAEANNDIPILVQVTVETTGTLLAGADIGAAATVVHALGVPIMGLNCATGPQEMAEHVKWLRENWPGHISVQPNAGLPELVEGETCYPLTPEELAKWQERFIVEDGISIVGGCCGTNDSHIAALNSMLGAREGVADRPSPSPRKSHWVPSVASLFSQVPLHQENAYLSIGERCNANGSKKFREAQEAEDWDVCEALAREQVKEGSHTLDVCTAFVGRDEISDMNKLVNQLRGAVDAPLVIDSTEFPVLEEALKLYGGKAILNSINFEDGEEPAAKRLALARTFGAAVIALTIDEKGMAKEPQTKVSLAHRLHEFACNVHGLPASDLFFDPLTFTICTGNEEDRKLGLWTLDAIEKIAEELPKCQIVLGLSNISFGLNPAARHVLNSVYLDHALRCGLTAAIAHLGKIRPLHGIPGDEVKVAEDLIFDRRHADYDPLVEFMALFEDRTSASAVRKAPAARVEERLKNRIIDGDKVGLDVDLDEALKSHAALSIINSFLLDGMKVVGELFGAGQMQLPFVLKSAETMKAAVAHLEPYMEKVKGQERGTIVLATVRGDVHDIGKNLVDIILTNNGYNVVNLGIKQPIAAILDAAASFKAQAIGMSGLLVKSTVIMRENLEEMSRLDLDIPVFLGGAALTRKYVEEDCVRAYKAGRVAYARDAFDGLKLLDRVIEGTFDDYVSEVHEKWVERPNKNRKRLGQAENSSLTRPVDLEEVRIKRTQLSGAVKVPEPPFWGPRLIENISVRALIPFVNQTMLYKFQWGFRKAGLTREKFNLWAEKEVRPIFTRLIEMVEGENILKPQACYGYWKAAAEGNDIILFDEDGEADVARFSLPRQGRGGGLCISDFVRDIGDKERDVIGLQAVTVGEQASAVAQEWFEADRYQDYLYLHGLGVEMAEALAEYVHKRIRGELGFGHEDDRIMEKLLKQGYRGSRFSFGYPACPNLADQRVLLELLDAKNIGLVMAEEDQLHPEQSTTALVIHHPQAKYFST